MQSVPTTVTHAVRALVIILVLLALAGIVIVSRTASREAVQAKAQAFEDSVRIQTAEALRRAATQQAAARPAH